MQCSGSGIYAGRLGALEVFVSEVATTKVLIAKVPADPQFHLAQSQPAFIGKPISHNGSGSLQETFATGFNPNPMETDHDHEIDKHFAQDNMTVFEMKFLDFSKNVYHDGEVCQDGICCHYDIAINRNQVQMGKVRH